MLSTRLDGQLPRQCLPLIPSLSPVHLSRPRLIERLNERAWRLILAWAPAGYGKSALLAEYLNQQDDTDNVVWLNLGGCSLSAPELLARIAASQGIPWEGQADVPSRPQWLYQLDQPLHLVLDDFPVDVSPELNAAMDSLIADPQLNVQVLVTSRHRPNWNLPRLLLADALIELDAKHLAFTVDEQHELAARLQPHISPASNAELWAQTQGWCAAPRLILSGEMRPQDSTFAQDCWLNRYLEQEWLARLTPEQCDALADLAHLPKCSAQLCEQLWEGREGAQLFRGLQAAQSFFYSSDKTGVWYQLLPAVARALQFRLSRSARDALRLRACTAFHALGQTREAVELALEAGQEELAVGYLECLGLDWLVSERNLSVLFDWKARIPTALLERTPRLSCLFARAMLVSWRLDEAEHWIENLRRFLPSSCPSRQRRLLANWQTLRGALEGMRGNAEVASRHCLDALADLGEADWRSSVLCLSTLTRIAMADGQLEQAQQHLRKAVELTRRYGCVVSELLIDVDRIRLLILRGKVARADALLVQSLIRVDEQAGRHRLLSGRLLLLRAELHLLAGRLDVCAEDLHTGICHAQQAADPIILHGLLMAAELASRRGEHDLAFDHLREAERRMHCEQVPASLFKHVLGVQSMRILANQRNWASIVSIGRSIEAYLQDRLPPLNYPALPQHVECLLRRAEQEAGRDLPAASEPGGELVRLKADLTVRELSVLQLLAEGFSNQEIGNNLFISLNTVKTHAKSINDKLSVRRRTHAVMRAQSLGLLG